MSRYEAELRPLSVLRRDPVISQEIRWNFGPNLGDTSSMSVVASGRTVTIRESTTEVMSIPLDRARLLYEALGNVVEAVDSTPSLGLAAIEAQS